MSSWMEPSDLSLLVVLGTAERGPASLKEIVATAKQLAPLDWQPTAETIGAALERAIHGGLATADISTTGGEAVIQTTDPGNERMVELLQKPIPRTTGGFVRSCMSVKACFLDKIPRADRAEQAHELAQLYRDAIGLSRRLLNLPRPLSGPALDDLRWQLVQLESELTWLDSLAIWPLQQLAAE